MVVVALVTGETLDLVGVAQRHPTAYLCIVGPVCRTVDIEDGTRLCIDQGRRFQRSNVAIRAIDVVAGCRFTVEKRGIQGTVLARIASGRRPVEQLPPDTS